MREEREREGIGFDPQVTNPLNSVDLFMQSVFEFFFVFDPKNVLRVPPKS